MARVHLLEVAEAPLSARSFFASGTPGSITRALAHVPELLEKAMPFIGAIYGPSGIPPRPKEILVVRISAKLACRFCTETHAVVARDAGLTVAEVRALIEGEVEAHFPSERERALIAWSDRLASGDPITAADHAAIAAHFPPHEVVELTMIGGATLMLNRFCSALELPTSPAARARAEAEGLV